MSADYLKAAEQARAALQLAKAWERVAREANERASQHLQEARAFTAVAARIQQEETHEPVAH